jgi:hypothetical protein
VSIVMSFRLWAAALIGLSIVYFSLCRVQFIVDFSLAKCAHDLCHALSAAVAEEADVAGDSNSVQYWLHNLVLQKPFVRYQNSK